MFFETILFMDFMVYFIGLESREKIIYTSTSSKGSMWMLSRESSESLLSIICSSSVCGICRSSSLDLNSRVKIVGGNNKPRMTYGNAQIIGSSEKMPTKAASKVSRTKLRIRGTLILVLRLMRSPPIHRSDRSNWEDEWARNAKWPANTAQLRHVCLLQHWSSYVSNCSVMLSFCL